MYVIISAALPAIIIDFALFVSHNSITIICQPSTHVRKVMVIATLIKQQEQVHIASTAITTALEETLK